MTMETAALFITGLFLGGVITEVRWILRLSQFQRQIELSRTEEEEKVTEAETLWPPEPALSVTLRSLHDHLVADAGVTPTLEPANLAKRNI
jgi:hypothetical protein